MKKYYNNVSLKGNIVSRNIKDHYNSIKFQILERLDEYKLINQYHFLGESGLIEAISNPFDLTKEENPFSKIDDIINNYPVEKYSPKIIDTCVSFSTALRIEMTEFVKKQKSENFENWFLSLGYYYDDNCNGLNINNLINLCRIFVSSSFDELKEEYQKVIEEEVENNLMVKHYFERKEQRIEENDSKRND